MALELRDQGGFLIVRQVRHILGGMVEVGVVQRVAALGEKVDLDGLLFGADDPVLGDAALLIDGLFAAAVIYPGAWGKDLHHQVGRTMDAVRLDLIPVTYHHEVRDIVVRAGQKDLFAIPEGDAGLPMQEVRKNPIDVPRDAVVVGGGGGHHDDLPANQLLAEAVPVC